MDSDVSNKAVVIGNGESRKTVNLELYRNSYVFFGCNAIHRDTVVDHLICCDRRMVDESTNNPNTSNTQIYVRSNWYHYFKKIKKNKNINLLPKLPYTGDTKKDQPDHWGSGVYALLLAADMGFTEIELLGYDLYSNNTLVNNIYKGSKNYSKETANAVDYSYWVYQIGKVFNNYPNSQFVIRNNKYWCLPKEWQKSNVKFIAL